MANSAQAASSANLFTTGLLKFVDLKLGYRLMLDRRVPMRCKLLAMGFAVALTGILEFLELPIEGMVAGLIPVIGLAGDIAVDGIELVAGPLLFACMLLPWLTPSSIASQVRGESNGSAKPPGKGPIIDV